MCFLSTRRKRRDDRDELLYVSIVQILDRQDVVIKLLGEIMSKQSDLEDQVTALGGGFDSIVTYLGKIKSDLEAANAAAGDTVDLTPLVKKVAAITAFADGLNPTTPAEPVELPSDTVGDDDAEEETEPPVIEDGGNTDGAVTPPEGDTTPEAEVGETPEPAPVTGPLSTPDEVPDTTVEPVTGTAGDEVAPEDAIRPNDAVEGTEN